MLPVHKIFLFSPGTLFLWSKIVSMTTQNLSSDTWVLAMTTLSAWGTTKTSWLWWFRTLPGPGTQSTCSLLKVIRISSLLILPSSSHHFSDLLATDSVPLVTPYHQLELPFTECPHVLPCLALTATSLLVARKGTNTLLRMSVWNENNNNPLWYETTTNDLGLGVDLSRLK